MLVDHRTYSVRVGTLSLQLAMYEKFGLKPQWEHLGIPMAFLTAETGELNTYVHIWMYKNAADREQRRSVLNADPAWKHYLAQSTEAGYVLAQHTKLMTPSDFASHKTLAQQIAEASS